MAKTDEEAQQIDFIERRRASLERYLNRLGKHKVLVQDPDFRDFLEQEEVSFRSVAFDLNLKELDLPIFGPISVG